MYQHGSLAVHWCRNALLFHAFSEKEKNKQTNSKPKLFIALQNTAKYWGLWGKVKGCKSFLNSIYPAKLHEVIVHNLCAGTLSCFSFQNRPKWNLDWQLSASTFFCKMKDLAPLNLKLGLIREITRNSVALNLVVKRLIYSRIEALRFSE